MWDCGAGVRIKRRRGFEIRGAAFVLLGSFSFCACGAGMVRLKLRVYGYEIIYGGESQDCGGRDAIGREMVISDIPPGRLGFCPQDIIMYAEMFKFRRIDCIYESSVLYSIGLTSCRHIYLPLLGKCS